jgi:hypothetical protein
MNSSKDRREHCSRPPTKPDKGAMMTETIVFDGDPSPWVFRRRLSFYEVLCVVELLGSNSLSSANCDADV